ncbi:MAG: YdeI/OmpD-associated family protein [Bacteroidota bacterium]|nr:YdeI/OmpD-associated family protein [Bacteroidota bacterium]
MGKIDTRIDAYISKSQHFAKPVLNHFRNLVHTACPNVEETIKWGFPHFDYKGMFCNMAAFKQHCAFGFWKTSLMKDAQEMMGKNEHSMGHLGKITSLKDLPSDKKILGWLREAMKLNDDNIKLPERKKTIDKKELEIPASLQKALKENKAAVTFDAFSLAHKKEYIEWINEAKTEDTRNKRIAQTIEWVLEGKSRNWKYMKK